MFIILHIATTSGPSHTSQWSYHHRSCTVSAKIGWYWATQLLSFSITMTIKKKTCTVYVYVQSCTLYAFVFFVCNLGRELLRMQGLSYDSTLLNNFSESNLTDLAGNACLGLMRVLICAQLCIQISSLSYVLRCSGTVLVALIMSVLATIGFTTDSEAENEEEIENAFSKMQNIAGRAVF